MCTKDQSQRFLFEDFDIRGQLVGLQQSYIEALSNHNYPAPIEKLMGEFMAAAVLLSATIKTTGTLSIQAQGDGDLRLIMAECCDKQQIRAIARWEAEHCKENLLDLLGNARLVITIEPDEGQRYQGIVPLTSNKLSDCLEAYFEQSEQLKTRVWLNAEPHAHAAGLLLQALPQSDNDFIAEQETEDAWERISLISNTVTGQELIQLDNETLLHRLYHEEALRIFTPANVVFKCTCDENRTLQAIISLGKEEVESIFEERDMLEAQCEFCNKIYSFSYAEIEPYLMEQEIRDLADDLNPSRTLH